MVNRDRLKIIITVGLLIIAGLSLIAIGLGISLGVSNSKLKAKEAELVSLNRDYEEMTIKYDDEHNERIRQELINNDLWELYYTIVTSYDGEYEVYE